MHYRELADAKSKCKWISMHAVRVGISNIAFISISVAADPGRCGVLICGSSPFFLRCFGMFEMFGMSGKLGVQGNPPAPARNRSASYTDTYIPERNLGRCYAM